MVPAWLRDFVERYPNPSLHSLYLCGECKDVTLAPMTREFRKCGMTYCNNTHLEPLVDTNVLFKLFQDLDGNIITTRTGKKEPKYYKE